MARTGFIAHLPRSRPGFLRGVSAGPQRRSVRRRAVRSGSRLHRQWAGRPRPCARRHACGPDDRHTRWARPADREQSPRPGSVRTLDFGGPEDAGFGHHAGQQHRTWVGHHDLHRVGARRRFARTTPIIPTLPSKQRPASEGSEISALAPCLTFPISASGTPTRTLAGLRSTMEKTGVPAATVWPGIDSAHRYCRRSAPAAAYHPAAFVPRWPGPPRRVPARRRCARSSFRVPS